MRFDQIWLLIFHMQFLVEASEDKFHSHMHLVLPHLDISSKNWHASSIFLHFEYVSLREIPTKISDTNPILIL